VPLPRSLQQNKSCHGDRAPRSIHQAPEAALRHGWSLHWTQANNAKASNPTVHQYKPKFIQLHPDLHSCFRGGGKNWCKWQGGGSRPPFNTNVCPAGICQTVAQPLKHVRSFVPGYPRYHAGFWTLSPGKMLHAEVRHSSKPPALLQTSLAGDNYPRNDTAPCRPQLIS